MSQSDDETSIGMPRLFNRTWGKFTNNRRSHSNNSEQILNLQQNMVQMSTMMKNMESAIHNLSSQNQDTQLNHNTNNFYSPHSEGNNRFLANDVQVITKGPRDQSPTGMSRTHAKELLKSLNDYVNGVNSRELDERNKERLTDQTSNQIKEIFKAQKQEDYYNQPHIKCTTYNCLTPSFLLDAPQTYNADKVFHKNRIIYRQMLNLESVGLKAFLEQLNSFDLSTFTQYEYNTLIHMMLSRELKEKIEVNGGNPLKLSTSDYLDRLNRSLNGNITSSMDFDERFSKFKPTSKNILSILYEYKKYLENVSNDIISDVEKQRKIISAVIKFIPFNIRPLLDATAALQGGKLTLSAFENFIRTHETSIDRFLNKNNLAQKGYIKKLDSNFVEQDVYSENLYDTFDMGTQDDYDDYNHDYDHVHGIHKITNSYQSRLSLKCDICKRYAHTDKMCIFNEIDSVRLENLKKTRIRHCLLCRSLTHVDTECTFFKGVKPCPNSCKNCQDAGYFQYHHPVEACLKNNFLERIKASEVTK